MRPRWRQAAGDRRVSECGRSRPSTQVTAPTPRSTTRLARQGQEARSARARVLDGLARAEVPRRGAPSAPSRRTERARHCTGAREDLPRQAESSSTSAKSQLGSRRAASVGSVVRLHTQRLLLSRRPSGARAAAAYGRTAGRSDAEGGEVDAVGGSSRVAGVTRRARRRDRDGVASGAVPARANPLRVIGRSLVGRSSSEVGLCA